VFLTPIPNPPAFDLSRLRRAPPSLVTARPCVGAAAPAVTLPHALGLGLIAFAPFAQLMPVSVPALWSAALLTLFSRVKGVVNGIARAAYVHADADGTVISTLEWKTFKTWSLEHLEATLVFMKELARLGIRRLGAASQQLRVAMA